MPALLNDLAQITCVHGGQVTVIATQAGVLAEGGAIICEPDLVGAPIVGCPQPSVAGSTKPCTTVVSTLPGSTSLTVAVDGRPAYVETLDGVTDGVPPGSLIVVFPGQLTSEG